MFVDSIIMANGYYRGSETFQQQPPTIQHTMDGFNSGKPSLFSFGANNVKQGDTDDKGNKPTFSFNASSEPATKPTFTFGTSQSNNDTKKTAGFGFGSTSTSSGFGFGSKIEPSSDKPSFGFGKSSETSKPEKSSTEKSSFAFGSSDSASKPTSSGFGSTTSTESTDKPSPFAFGKTPDITTKPALFGNSTSGSTPSLFEKSTDKESEKPSFAFGKAIETETTKPSFVFGKSEESKPFLFGNSTTGSKPSLFGNSASSDSKPSLVGNKETTDRPAPSFGLGKPTEPSSTTQAFSFGSKTEESKPTFGFGSKTEENKPSISFGSNKEESNPLFSFGNKSKDENNEAKETEDTKSKEDKFMKYYRAPSVDHLILDNDIDISEDFHDGQEFYDIDIDEKSNLPIRKLDYNENAKSLLSNGEHLKFAVSGKTENGMIFVTESEEKLGKKDNKAETKTELFPFKLIQEMDPSSEYKEFLNKLYKEFEPILKHKQYKHYLDEDDEYMNIGILSAHQNDKEERKLLLSQLMAFLLNNLNELINFKLNIDFETLSDEWVTNYEQIINVLYLLNALHFGNDDETIVLFQQWIERIDIQPTDELIQRVLKESDKPYQNGAFWSDYVKKFVLRGSFSKLVDDLNASQYEELKTTDNELFRLIENLISLIQSYDPITFSKNIESFFAWKRVAVELRESANDIYTDNMIILGEIIEILYIMTGSPKTIEESSNEWYECFMGHYLYQMPSKELIKGYLSEALQLDTYEKPLPGIAAWDTICVDLFDGKFLSVIAAIESLDKSIGTFTAIIMEAAGLLNVYNKEISNTELINKAINSNNISNNIDRMIEDLALTYLNSQELFAIGVGILVSIDNTKSREIIAELLPTYEIKDSDDFEWVLSICSQLKLAKTMKTIQQIQGEKFYDKNLIANALSCFAESKSADKIVSTVWSLFEDLLINQRLDADLSNQLFASDLSKTNAILRQSLSPLYTLNQILNNNGVFDETWFGRLYGLLEFKYLPHYYKCGLMLIIYDNLNKSIFNIEHLVAIIENLNEYEKEIGKDEDLKSKSSSMYSLLLKSRLSDKGRAYPETLSGLFLSVRRGIAMDVSFTFLDDSMY